MKKIIALMGIVTILIWVSSCASTAKEISTGGPSVSKVQAERYDGPKAKLAVLKPEDRTVKKYWRGDWKKTFSVSWEQISGGIRNMLTTALLNSNRFIVLEEEQVAEPDRPDLVISVAILEFYPKMREGVTFEKWIGGAKAVLIGGAKLESGYISMGVLIINGKTIKPVASKKIEGRASSYGESGAKNIGGKFPKGLRLYSETCVEEAIRVCIQRAVQYISRNTPDSYYRYNK